MRPKGIKYPNGPYVHYAYPTAPDEALGRVAATRDDRPGRIAVELERLLGHRLLPRKRAPKPKRKRNQV